MPATVTDEAGIWHSMRTHRQLWRLCGIQQLPNDPIWYTICARLTQSNVIVFIVLMLLSVSEARTMDECVQVLLLANTFVLLAIKACIFRLNHGRVELAIGLMQELEASTLPHPVERAMLRNCAQWSHRMLLLFGFFSFFGVFSIALEPLMSGQKLIYPSKYPFNWLASRPLYYATFSYQLANNLCLALYFPTADAYGPTMYLHLATYVRILCGRMMGLGAVVKGQQTSAGQRVLVECVEYHKMCLQLDRELNGVFGVHFAIQFGSSSFILCVAAYQFSLIFLPCFCGSLVLKSSDDLCTSLYESNWIAQTEVYKSIMRISMVRAKWPITLYIYRQFCIIHLGAFVTIFRYAYSMFTFMKSF